MKTKVSAPQLLLTTFCILGFASLSSCYQPHGHQAGWIPTDGQLYSTKTFPALFAAIGSRYGGDGKTTYAVPDRMNNFALLADMSDEPGTHALYPCISVVEVNAEMNFGERPIGTQPAGTEAWCEGSPFVPRHPNLVFDSREWRAAQQASKPKKRAIEIPNP